MAERRPLYDTGAGLKEFDPASGDTLAGAGAGGSSGINYVTNPDFEVDASGWAAYADAAGASPVDGTGGSPVVTITRSTTTPLRKTASGLITKDAANRQGNGVSYDFTIDSAQKGRALSVLFDYIIGSGTFAAGDASSDGDITVYVYDVTNARLIPMSDRKLYSNSATLSSKFIGLFQASPDSTSYRLIIHCGSTSASAYTLRFDEVQVSPLATFPASVVTDWQAFPSVAAGTLITGSTSNPTYGTVAQNVAYWRRVGDSMEIVWNYRQTTAGGAGTGTYLFNTPPGYQIDTTRLPANTSQFDSVVGDFKLFSANAGTDGVGKVAVYSATQLWVQIFRVTLTPGIAVDVTWAASSSAINFSSGTDMAYCLRATVPIAGWGSAITSALTGDDGRVITARYTTTVSATSDSSNPIQWNTKVSDTHNAVTTGSAWKFTAPVWGFYRASIQYHCSGGTTYARLYKNGVDQGILTNEASAGTIVAGSTTIELKAGDYIDMRSGNSVTIAASANYSITIEKVAGNAVAVGFVTPEKIARINFNGTGTVAIRSKSSNISGINDHGTGEYSVDILPGVFSNGDYAATVTVKGDGGAPEGCDIVSQTATNFRFIMRAVDGTPIDCSIVNVIMIGE